MPEPQSKIPLSLHHVASDHLPRRARPSTSSPNRISQPQHLPARSCARGARVPRLLFVETSRSSSMAPPCASSRCPRRTPPSLGLVPPRASSCRRPSHLDRAPSTPQQNQVATPLPFIFSSALFSPPRNLSLPLQELLHHAMAAPELASFPERPRLPSELARPRRGFPAVARLVIIAPWPASSSS